MQQTMQQMQRQIHQLQSQMEPKTSCHTPEILSVGDVVYRQGQLASVVAVDHSLSPPSYVVRMAQSGDEVNCEIDNLVIPNRLNVPNATNLPETNLPSFADVVQRQRLELEPQEQGEALLRDMHEELQDALPQMPQLVEGPHSGTEMGPDMRFEGGCDYGERPWAMQTLEQTPEMHCLPPYSQQFQLQMLQQMQMQSAQECQESRPSACQAFDSLQGNEYPKNYALQALTEALDRAEVEMLSGRQRHSDVSEVMHCGFEDSQFSPSCARQSSNFALKAATEALSRALDDKPKSDCAKEIDSSLLTALGLRQNPASKEWGGHKLREQDQGFESFQPPKVLGQENCFVPNQALKERREWVQEDPFEGAFPFEVEPTTPPEERRKRVQEDPFEGAFPFEVEPTTPPEERRKRVQEDPFEGAFPFEAEPATPPEDKDSNVPPMIPHSARSHAQVEMLSGRQRHSDVSEVMHCGFGDSHFGASGGRQSSNFALKEIDRSLLTALGLRQNPASKEWGGHRLREQDQGFDSFRAPKERREQVQEDPFDGAFRFQVGPATPSEVARVRMVLVRKVTPRGLMKAPQPRSRDHLVDFVLDGSGRSTTPSFVDGSLSRNSPMKGKAMSTCYRDFPSRKVTPRRQGGKVRPTAALPPLSKKKIYQWQ